MVRRFRPRESFPAQALPRHGISANVESPVRERLSTSILVSQHSGAKVRRRLCGVLTPVEVGYGALRRFGGLEEAGVKQKTAVGELVILKVDDGVASALVTYSTVGISAGDSVERR